MKKLLTLIITLFAFVAVAQSQKLDAIIKKDYSIIEANVTKVSERTIEYSLPKETLINSIDVSQVVRIDFANGRKQSFSNVVAPATDNHKQPEVAIETDQQRSRATQEREIKQNTIAVLPIPFVNAETLASSEEMAKFAQNDVYSQLIDKAANIFPLTVQDLRLTNSLLKKAGIDYKNIDETPIEDLQKILGVDNILAAKVSYTVKVTQSTGSYSSGEVKVENNKASGNDFSYSSTDTDKNYEYNVYFDYYRNLSKIYTQTRQPFLQLKDSWKDSMAYLLKRCPVYNKR